MKNWDRILSQWWRDGQLLLLVAALLYGVHVFTPGVGIYDWRKEIAYFQYIREALSEHHTLPYVWWNKPTSIVNYPAVAYTSIFVANPETMLFSPFTPLLSLIGVAPFIKIVTAGHFIIGALGLWALRRRLGWGPTQFRAACALILLSPIVFQHVAIGYTPWLNLLLFPWLVFFFTAPGALAMVGGTAGVIALTLLQGGAHVATWFALLFGIYSIVRTIIEKRPVHLLSLLAVAALTVLLAWARLATTGAAYSGFHQSFQPGYSPASFLFWALVPTILLGPFEGAFLSKVWAGVPAWDGAIYWGAALPMLGVLAWNYRRYRREQPSPPAAPLHLDALLIASAVLLALSFGPTLAWLVRGANAVMPMTWLEAVEKYPFRLAIPAYFGFSLCLSTHAGRIWNTLHAWLMHPRPVQRLAGGIRQFARSRLLASALRILAALLLIGAFVGLLARPAADKAVDAIVRAAYSNSGWSLLSRTMGGRDAHPVDHYLQIARHQYTLVLGALFTLALLLVISERFVRRGWPEVERAERLALPFEALLVIPFVICCSVWLRIATSEPMRDFDTWTLGPPETRLESTPALTTVSPAQLHIRPLSPASHSHWYFPRIPYRDHRFLLVSPASIAVTEHKARLKLTTPNAEGTVTVSFDTKPTHRAIGISAVAWFILLLAAAVTRFTPRTTPCKTAR